ncbi:MAG: NADPH-dependent F420 reductase [Thaumarchaeota archaeon]|nr:NADPH-dependent F420 reductase [Nitrososphaerota archaeon]
MSRKKSIAVIGGTGGLGLGLAARLAKSWAVTIGSREEARAAAAALRIASTSGGTVEGKANEEAARSCDIAIFAVPDLPPGELFASLAPGLEGKLVISPIVPLKFKDGVFTVPFSEESATERVAKSLPGSHVAGAFHTVPAPKLADLHEGLDYDVLVTAESREVFEQAAQVVSSVGRLRPFYAGPLRTSRMVEAFTPTLLNVSRLNKLDNPSIKIV